MLTFDQEIFTRARAALKQIVPPQPACPCGTITRLRPDLQNVRPDARSAGKATALGRRTAWLRLLVNTVELVMAIISFVYP